jgi:hypothetical protein
LFISAPAIEIPFHESKISDPTSHDPLTRPAATLSLEGEGKTANHFKKEGSHILPSPFRERVATGRVRGEKDWGLVLDPSIPSRFFFIVYDNLM